jgi:hypothetical protein
MQFHANGRYGKLISLPALEMTRFALSSPQIKSWAGIRSLGFFQIETLPNLYWIGSVRYTGYKAASGINLCEHKPPILFFGR